MRDPFAPPEPVAATAAQLAAALLRTRPTLLEGLGAAAGEGFWRSGIGQLLAEADVGAAQRRASAQDSAPLSREAWQASPFFREGVAWDERMSTARARAIAEIVDENANRRRVLADRDAGTGEQVLQFFAGLGGSLLTPENFIPFAGPLLRAAQMGRLAGTSVGRAALGLERATVSSSRAARVAAGGAIGAVDATIGTALTMPLVDASRQRFGDDDTTLAEAIMDLSLGAAAGFVLGGALRLRTPRGATPPASGQGEAPDAVNPPPATAQRAAGPDAPAVNGEAARAMPAPDADMVRGALDAVALGADQVARAGGRINLAEDPKVVAEMTRMRDAYRAVRDEPLGPIDEPLVRLDPEGIRAVIVQRGPVRERDGDIVIGDGRRDRGHGLVKVIWRHGEKSQREPALRVTEDDVVDLPRIVRQFEARAGTKPDNREWRVNRPGQDGTLRTVVYAAAPMREAGDQDLLVSIYVQDPGRSGAEKPLSVRRAGDAASPPEGSEPSTGGIPERAFSLGDTAGQQSPAPGDIAPRPLDFTSPADAPARPAPEPPAGRAADLGADPEQVEADARLAEVLAARGDLPDDLRAALAASAEVEAGARDLRQAFDTAAACALGRI